MRSTLILDDHLFKWARQRAAAMGTTVSDVVNQALREAVSKPAPKPAKFHMITFGDPDKPQHREPSDFAEVLDDDDARSLAR